MLTATINVVNLAGSKEMAGSSTSRIPKNGAVEGFAYWYKQTFLSDSLGPRRLLTDWMKAV